MPEHDTPKAEFLSPAGRSPENGFALLGEIWWFLRTTGKWWLVPVLVALIVLGALVLVSSSVYAPFLYTLF